MNIPKLALSDDFAQLYLLSVKLVIFSRRGIVALLVNNLGVILQEPGRSNTTTTTSMSGPPADQLVVAGRVAV